MVWFWRSDQWYGKKRHRFKCFSHMQPCNGLMKKISSFLAHQLHLSFQAKTATGFPPLSPNSKGRRNCLRSLVFMTFVGVSRNSHFQITADCPKLSFSPKPFWRIQCKPLWGVNLTEVNSRVFYWVLPPGQNFGLPMNFSADFSTWYFSYENSQAL